MNFNNIEKIIHWRNKLVWPWVQLANDPWCLKPGVCMLRFANFWHMNCDQWRVSSFMWTNSKLVLVIRNHANCIVTISCDHTLLQILIDFLLSDLKELLISMKIERKEASHVSSSCFFVIKLSQWYVLVIFSKLGAHNFEWIFQRFDWSFRQYFGSFEIFTLPIIAN